MSADAGGDEADFLERVAIHQKHAVGVHAGDEKDPAIRCDANVLGMPRFESRR
jgi:hypothetical protein